MLVRIDNLIGNDVLKEIEELFQRNILFLLKAITLIAYYHLYFLHTSTSNE